MGESRAADLGSQLDGFLNDLARRIAHYMGEQRRQAPQDGLIDQESSPLGRGHNAAVRRRIAAGESGADIVGRRHFLTREALSEEMARGSKRRVSKARTTDELEAVADLDRALSRLGRRD